MNEINEMKNQTYIYHNVFRHPKHFATKYLHSWTTLNWSQFVEVWPQNDFVWFVSGLH